MSVNKFNLTEFNLKREKGRKAFSFSQDQKMIYHQAYRHA